MPDKCMPSSVLCALSHVCCFGMSALNLATLSRASFMTCVFSASRRLPLQSHWTQVLRIVSLTPHQLLQCAVLYDIFSQCKAAVATQRVTLAATLQRMQQKRPYNGARAQAAGPATDADAEATACCEKSVEVMMEEAAIIRRLQEGLVKERCVAGRVARISTCKWHTLPAGLSACWCEVCKAACWPCERCRVKRRACVCVCACVCACVCLCVCVCAGA